MPTHADLSEKIRQWATLKAQTDLVLARMNKLRDDLMATIEASGDRDEKGNSLLHLTAPISAGDKHITALKREARTTPTLNEERAMALAHEKGLEDKLIVHEPHIDMDALYAAWQRGTISESELDGLFDVKTTYAFKPVTS